VKLRDFLRLYLKPWRKPSEIDIVYKLFFEDFDNIKSWARVDTDVGGIIYKMNHWNTALPEYAERGLHLCVFNTLENLMGFITHLHPFWPIFKCEARGLVAIPKDIDGVLPPGTLMYREIKPIHRLTWPEIEGALK
jgi:hypothetical protein